MTAIRIGMDVGSTTVKAVVLDQGYGFDAEGQRIHQPFSQDDPQVLFADYRRHHANVRATAQELLTDIHQTLAAAGRGEEPVQLAITGSGGISLADHIHVLLLGHPFHGKLHIFGYHIQNCLAVSSSVILFRY